MTKTELNSWVTEIQGGIERFTVGVDMYLSEIRQEDYDMDGPTLRQWQTRLARLNADLEVLYRRLEF